MPLLRAEAEKLSQSYLEAGIIEELITRDETFAYLPFMGVNGKSFDYVREDADGMAAAIAGNAHAKFIDVNEDIPEAAVGFVEVTAKLRRIAAHVDTDAFLTRTMGDTNSQKAAQIAAKAKIVAQKFRRVVAIGDASTSPLEFDGLPNLVSAGQTLDAGPNGAVLDFDMLDELKDKINYGADVLIMHSKTWRYIKTMLRALNIVPEHIALPEVGITVPTYDGTPIIRNDYLATDEEIGSSGAVCTSVYAARFNEDDGLFALYGGGNAGLVIQDMGLIENRDVERTRILWYTSVALKSTKALARIKGITLS